MASRSRRAAPAKPTTDPDGPFAASDAEEVPGAGRGGNDEDAAITAGGGAELRDPEGDEVSKPANDPTAKKAQPKVQQRAKDAAPLVPGGSAAAAREASPGDFIKAKIPSKYGSATIYGRGGKETVHPGGAVVEMTRAQAERIGAVEVKAKARVEPDADEDDEEE